MYKVVETDSDERRLNMNYEKKIRALRVSEETFQFLKAYAEENQTSMASVVRKALVDFAKTQTV